MLEFMLSYFPKLDVIISKYILIDLIHTLEEIKFCYGEYIFKENEKSDKFFIIY